MLWLRTLPSDILLFVANLGQDVNCFAVANFAKPFGPISLNNVKTVD